MKSVSLFVLLFCIAFSSTAQTKWVIDEGHTKIKFSVSHLMVAEVEGEFKSFKGKVVTKGDSFEDAQIEFSIDVNSITTNHEQRDEHLKNDDFFNAEKFPQITFKAISFKIVEGNKYLLEGDLKIRDVKKRVKLDVVYNGTLEAWGQIVAGFKITGTLNRFDYNLNWNNLANNTAVVGKDVSITVNLELNKE